MRSRLLIAAFALLAIASIIFLFDLQRKQLESVSAGNAYVVPERRSAKAKKLDSHVRPTATPRATGRDEGTPLTGSAPVAEATPLPFAETPAIDIPPPVEPPAQNPESTDGTDGNDGSKD